MTLRELELMADGRLEAEWAQTATLAAVTWNCHCGSRSQGKSAHDFNDWQLAKESTVHHVADARQVRSWFDAMTGSTKRKRGAK